MGSAHHAKKSKKIIAPSLILLAIAGYVAWAVLQPMMSLTALPTTTLLSHSAKEVKLPWPSYGESAIGAAGYGVVATSGNQTPLPTASIAKVITALAVLRQKPLQPGQQGPNITISAADIDSYTKYVAQDGSVVPVSTGEQITEYQALQALLLPSANNMAETLARWAFGSLDAYNTFANNYAKGLGLASIAVTDPSGFLPTTVGSASDLATLGELAMLNPVFAEIVAQPTAIIPVAGTIYNYNFLLGKNNNVGIKTGNNDQDKGAYLFAVKQPVGDSSVTMVGAVMGGPDLATVLKDSAKLAQDAITHFSQVTFVNTGQNISSYNLAGKSIAVVASKPLTMIAWDGTPFTTTSTTDVLHGPVAVGAKVGTVQVTNGINHISNSVPAVLAQPVTKPSLVWRLTHPF